MKSSVLLVATVLIIGLGAGCKNTAAVTWPDGEVIYPELALTASQQAQGLSGRDSVGEGMLFCFTEAKQRTFWMLDMHMPIDIIWLHEGVVVDVNHAVPIREFGDWARRLPSKPADAVLEVEAGLAQTKTLGVGQELVGVKHACNTR